MIPLKDDNPTASVPYVTFGLIAVNLFVYTYLLFLGRYGSERLVLEYAAVPARMFGLTGEPVTAGILTSISSMFLHGGLLHVGGNMLYLWIFGDNVEDVFGHVAFLLFYLACGLAGAYAHGLANMSSTVPMVGASGAVAGVLGAYVLMFPRARVWTFFFFFFFWQVIRVPAVIIIGLWILLQVANGLADGGTAEGGVAWFAHIGGFSTGALFALFAMGRVMKSRKRTA
jgi:membrane associated rhomboid family serine protease